MRVTKSSSLHTSVQVMFFIIHHTHNSLLKQVKIPVFLAYVQEIPHLTYRYILQSTNIPSPHTVVTLL